MFSAPPDTSTTSTTVLDAGPIPAVLTSADVDVLVWIGAGTAFLVVMLLVAIFVRLGSG